MGGAMLAFLAKLPPTVIVIEACGAAHYLARELGKLGHTAKLIAPQLVKLYVPRNKNDGRDAEGLCEAASRPRMRYVPVKTAEQQAALMLLGIREQLVGRRTQLSNTIRGHAAEFGLIAAKRLDKLASSLAAIERDERVPALAPRAVCNACSRIRAGAGRTEGDRGQASGLAPRRCLEPASGADPRCRSGHRCSAGHEGT
jgi:transposase